MTAGWGETEVFMDVSPRRLARVLHRHLAGHGLLSFLSLLWSLSFKRNQCVINGANGHQTQPSYGTLTFPPRRH